MFLCLCFLGTVSVHQLKEAKVGLGKLEVILEKRIQYDSLEEDRKEEAERNAVLEEQERQDKIRNRMIARMKRPVIK